MNATKSIEEITGDEAHSLNEKVVQESKEESVDTRELSDSASSSSTGRWSNIKRRFPYYRLVIHGFVGLFFTAWWVSIIAQEKQRPKWLIPTIFWLMITIRLITWHCRVLPWALGKVRIVWDYCTEIIYTKIFVKRWQRLVAGAVIVVSAILLGTFIPTNTVYSERSDRAISFFGIVVAVLGLFATSRNHKKVQWNTVIGGILMQFIVALFVLRTKAGYDIFNFISTLARELLGFAKNGVAFLTNTEIANIGMFFFAVLPAVIFFVAFVHIWYYFGVIQWAIEKFAYFFFWSLRVSGAEAITAAASPFIGIGESAILIKDLLPFLTKAELHQVMTSGFSTISGAVLVGYIGLGLNPQALVSSCVMSIPASLAVSKLRYPETEVPVSCGTVSIPKHAEDDADSPKNVLQAFSNGATLGLKIAGTMLTQCLCIIALVAFINGVLGWFGRFWNIDHLSMELMLSYILYPVSFLLGTPRSEILHVSKLIGTKFIQNEFVAYSMLIHDAPFNTMSRRGTLIATYSLCGFSNLGSMGITLGVLNTLTNSSRAKDISQTIVSALITGGIATLTSAAMAGMVIHDLDNFNLS